MQKQAVKQTFENNSLGMALETLANSIARWTDKDGPMVTAIPGLLLSRGTELFEALLIINNFKPVYRSQCLFRLCAQIKL